MDACMYETQKQTATSRGMRLKTRQKWCKSASTSGSCARSHGAHFTECRLQSCSSTVWQEEKVGVVEELKTAEKWEEEKLPFVIFSAWQERQRSRDVWEDLSLRSKNVIPPRSDPFRRGSQKASFYRSVPELAQSFNAAGEKLRS